MNLWIKIIRIYRLKLRIINGLYIILGYEELLIYPRILYLFYFYYNILNMYFVTIRFFRIYHKLFCNSFGIRLIALLIGDIFIWRLDP